MKNEEIFRYAGYSAYIASCALSLIDDIPDNMKSLDKTVSDLSATKCRWLIREMNIRMDRNEIANKWKRMFSALNLKYHIKVYDFFGIDWDSKQVLKSFEELKRIRNLADTLLNGCIKCGVHVRSLGDDLGLNGNKLCKFAQNGIFIEEDILNAINESSPADEGFVGRFQIAIERRRYEDFERNKD